LLISKFPSGYFEGRFKLLRVFNIVFFGPTLSSDINYGLV